MTETVWAYKEGSRWHAQSLRLLLDSVPQGNYRIVVSDSAQRSVPQNDRAHLVFRIIAGELNRLQANSPQIKRWTMEDVKEWCVAEFAPTVEFIDPNGEIHERRKRTHEMDVKEACEFMEALEAHFAVNFGIVIPEQDEQTDMNF